MAEFCINCFENIFGDLKDDKNKVVMSNDLDFCEGCEEYKEVVLKIED